MVKNEAKAAWDTIIHLLSNAPRQYPNHAPPPGVSLVAVPVYWFLNLVKREGHKSSSHSWIAHSLFTVTYYFMLEKNLE